MTEVNGKRGLAEWTVIPLLLVVCTAAFGLLLPRLGFYWDDWAKLLVSRLFGLSGYWAYYAEDRPLSGWTHILLTPVLGAAPIAWHVFTLIMRWLAAVGVWWTLRLLWPEHRRQAVYAALLFIIYPVFTQQPIALTFHQQWLQYVLYFFSVAAMLLSFSHPRHGIMLTGLSLAGMVLELSITEYFVGLEALRLVFIWIAVGRMTQGFRRRLLHLARLSWLYLFVLGAYVIWRLFFIRLPGEDPYQAEMLYSLFAQPVQALQTLVRMVGADSLYVLVGSWGPVVSLGLDQQNSFSFTIFVWGAAILAGVGLVFALNRLRFFGENEEPAGRGWMVQVLGVGLSGLLLGCLPGWITNRPVLFDFHSNRYAMPAMFGASLVWAAGLDWLVQRRIQKNILAGSLVAAATIFHLHTAGDYASIWKDELDFYWQLTWRAPMIEPNTAILGQNELFPNQGSFSTSAAINLLYPQERGRERLAYWYYNLWPRFAIEPSESPLGIPLRTQFRTLVYEGVTGESLVIFYDPGRANCLWVLGEDDAFNPDLPDLTRQMLAASDLSRIHREAGRDAPPDARMFGQEPLHGWCYYYQKAALAGQFEEWETVAALGDEARRNPEYYPKNPWFKTPHEWIPFIQGYAHTGRWQEAQEITIQAANIYQAKYRHEFCTLWDNLLKATPQSSEQEAATQEVWSSLNCRQR
ncbi:MAG: hypothetical protein IT308_10550 [Anaerolineaceae bacterium]|nr:hypothetical protein [Anaerolineaceae bacterium]